MFTEISLSVSMQEKLSARRRNGVNSSSSSGVSHGFRRRLCSGLTLLITVPIYYFSDGNTHYVQLWKITTSCSPLQTCSKIVSKSVTLGFLQKSVLLFFFQKIVGSMPNFRNCSQLLFSTHRWLYILLKHILAPVWDINESLSKTASPH